MKNFIFYAAYVINTFQAFPKPIRDFSVNEQMIGTKARISFIKY